MTQKDKAPAKRPPAARKSASAAVAKGRSPRTASEVDELRQQLAAANLRIALLERQRDEALNRIAWVIDSINSLAESVR